MDKNIEDLKKQLNLIRGNTIGKKKEVEKCFEIIEKIEEQNKILIEYIWESRDKIR